MPTVSRRSFALVTGLGLATGVGASTAHADNRRHRRSWKPPLGPRFRVISDNDYSGDPDGLWQLAHHALSPSVELVTVIGSHLAAGDPFDSSTTTADNAAKKARAVLRMIPGGSRVRVVAGSNVALTDRTTPIESAGARAIIEAAHADDPRPLFVCLGAGLSELASAWLMDPAISKKLTAVWIGGPEHEGHATMPPGGTPAEYNTKIDMIAAQVIFNDSDIPLWQVPRDAYRQALASMAELEEIAHSAGRLGRHLFDALADVHTLAGSAGLNMGETYIVGDNPLVLLTALQSSFEADPSSSRYVTRPCPRIKDDGTYEAASHGRSIRVYTQIDNRLLMSDLAVKLSRV